MLHRCFHLRGCENDGQIITLSGHLCIYLPEGEVWITEKCPPKVQNSQSRSGQLLVVVSERSKAEEGCMKRYRVAERHTSPTVAPGEHEGFGLRFKVKGKQHRDMWLNPCWSSVIHLQMLVLHCQHIWETWCLTHRQISALEGGQVVLWGCLLNEGSSVSAVDLLWGW